MNHESFPGVDVADLEKIASESGFRLESRFYPRFYLRLWGDGVLVAASAWDSSDYAWDMVYKFVMCHVPGALDKMRQLSFSRCSA